MTRPVAREYAPSVSGHGGGCCGMRHVRSFSPNLDADPDEIVRQLDAQVPFGRLSEVTLNLSQMRNYPRVMAKLAQLGFVLVGYFRNHNSSNNVGVFHLATTRLPMTELADVWNSQVITATMGGELAELRQMGTPNRTTEQGEVPPPFTVGATCRIDSPRSRYRGMNFRIVESGVSPHSGQARSRFVDEDRDDHTFWVLNTNLHQVRSAPRATGAAPRYLIDTLGDTQVRHPQQ